MPSSNYSQISKIMDLVVALNPQSVLDIGVGFGKYGVLCREFLELWDGREDYKTFLRRIDGIEAFPDYLTPLHDFIYNEVYVGNAVEVLDRLGARYDVVLLIDVLEHFDKKTGEELIKKVLSKSKGVIISIPKNIGVQEDVFSNPFEKHRASWTPKELGRLGSTHFVYDLLSTIVYIGEGSETKRLKSKNRSLLRAREILSRTPLLGPAYRFIKKSVFKK